MNGMEDLRESVKFLRAKIGQHFRLGLALRFKAGAASAGMARIQLCRAPARNEPDILPALKGWVSSRRIDDLQREQSDREWHGHPVGGGSAADPVRHTQSQVLMSALFWQRLGRPRLKPGAAFFSDPVLVCKFAADGPE